VKQPDSVIQPYTEKKALSTMKETYSNSSGKGGSATGDTPFEIGRVISVLVALVGLVLAYWFSSAGVFHFAVAFVVLPLGCIWYGKEIGSFATAEAEDAHNPIGSLITYTGWIVLSIMVAMLAWPAVRS